MHCRELGRPGIRNCEESVSLHERVELPITKFLMLRTSGLIISSYKLGITQRNKSWWQPILSQRALTFQTREGQPNGLICYVGGSKNLPGFYQDYEMVLGMK